MTEFRPGCLVAILIEIVVEGYLERVVDEFIYEFEMPERHW